MKRLLTIVPAFLVIGAMSFRPVAASASAETQLRFANKVKAGIAKLGSGPEARVEVKLRDKTRVKGYISEINENGFVVTDAKTGASNSVSYADVKQVKGNNLSTGARIAIGIAVVFAVLIVIGLIGLHFGD